MNSEILVKLLKRSFFDKYGFRMGAVFALMILAVFLLTYLTVWAKRSSCSEIGRRMNTESDYIGTTCMVLTESGWVPIGAIRINR